MVFSLLRANQTACDVTRGDVPSVVLQLRTPSRPTVRFVALCFASPLILTQSAAHIMALYILTRGRASVFLAWPGFGTVH